jgi:Cu/Ag efflux protein CusF
MTFKETHMKMTTSLFLIAALVAIPAAARAQKTVSPPAEVIKASATIQQIDSTRRRITFKNDDGSEDTMVAGPEFQRFNELKVGDKVNLTYYASTVYQVRKPGTKDPAQTDSAALVPANRALPGGTIAMQSVQTVTVKAINPETPSITVLTSDGRTVTRKVDQKSYLDGVKVGDKIDITYTESVLASVERGK